MKSWKSWLDIGTTVMVLVAASVVIWRNTARGTTASAPPLPNGPIPLHGSPQAGATSAEIAIVEFTDFECPYCAKFNVELMPQLRSEFVDTGRVRVSFRHFPLAMHRQARLASLAANCANGQGRFWEYQDLLFADQRRLGREDLVEKAEQSGLKVPAFTTCLDSGDEAVARDEALGKTLGVTGTPTFFVGRIRSDGQLDVVDRLTGARPYSEFKKSLESALRRAK